MAFVIGKPERFDISCLPAEVCITIANRDLAKPRAVLHDKIESFCTELDICTEGRKHKITIPESAAKCGPGRYYVSVYEDCVLCGQVYIRFKADCAISQVKVVQEPARKKRKFKS